MITRLPFIVVTLSLVFLPILSSTAQQPSKATAAEVPIVDEPAAADQPPDDARANEADGSDPAAVDEPVASNTAGDVIARFKHRLDGLWVDGGTDGFKAGGPDSPVAGITVTLFPTHDVLKTAAETGDNLIICHEPLFYQGAAGDADAETPDPVIAAKKKLIDAAGLVVYRFHDNLHRMKFDGIHRGMIDHLKWNKNLVEGTDDRFVFPVQTVGSFTNELAERLDTATIRVVGDPNMTFTKVGFSAGAHASADQVAMLRRDDVEVLVIGESREWQTYEYVRDLNDQGDRKALVVLGHNISEENGMRWCARWVRQFVKDVPVNFVPSRSPYWAVTR